MKFCPVVGLAGELPLSESNIIKYIRDDINQHGMRDSKQNLIKYNAVFIKYLMVK